MWLVHSKSALLFFLLTNLSSEFKVCSLPLINCNSPFYSCVLGCQAFEQE